MFQLATLYGAFWITDRVARRYSRLSPLWGVHAVVLSFLIGSICLSLLQLILLARSDLPLDSPTWKLFAVTPFWLWLVPNTLGMVVSVLIVGIVVSLVSRRPDKGMVQWAGQPVWGERYWIHACLALGYTVGVFLLSAEGPNYNGLLVTLALWGAVGRLAWLERRRKAATARRTNDARPPVLLLRGFDSTRQDPHRGEKSAGLFMGRPSFEERLAGAVDRHLGPLRSLGNPADFLPELGGTRHYVANSGWQETVADEMARAQCVLVMEGASPGLRWEWEYVHRNVPAPKVFLLTYPDKHLGRKEWVGTVAMLNEIGIGLPSRDPGGRSAYRFSEGWKAELLLAGGRDEDRVTEAVRPSVPVKSEDSRSLVLAGGRDEDRVAEAVRPSVPVKSEDSRSPLPRGRLAAGTLDWKWIGIGVVVTIALNLIPGLILGLFLRSQLESDQFTGGQIALVAVLILLAFAIGGFIVGLKSAGRTILEPGISAAIVVVIVLLISGDFGFGAIITGGIVPFIAGVLGGWLGKRRQGSVRDTSFLRGGLYRWTSSHRSPKPTVVGSAPSQARTREG